MKWLIMLGFMDLRGPRVCRRSTPVLLNLFIGERAGVLSERRRSNCTCYNLLQTICLERIIWLNSEHQQGNYVSHM